jgi:hypothetical protein
MVMWSSQRFMSLNKVKKPDRFNSHSLNSFGLAGFD